MTSARRHRRGSGVRLLIPFLIILGVFLFFKLTTKYWTGEDKLAIAVQNSDGNVSVVLLDPKLSEKTEFIIPSETEVDVSNNLGTIPVKNVVKLGMNEGMGGILLPRTITKSFLFPVSLWSDTAPDNIKFIATRNSNVPLGDRISIFLFTKRVKNLDVSLIDLGKSQFLTRAKLADGSLGYLVPDRISERLTLYFSDDSFAGSRVYIKDATGKFGVAERVGEILEVMGGKVVTIERLGKKDTDCLVGGKVDLVAKVVRQFGCEVSKETGEFDVQIELGSNFAQRF